MEWIKIEDEQPPIGRPVIMYVDGHVLPGMSHYAPDGQIVLGAMGGLDDAWRGGHVPKHLWTHWMPLPEPPSE